MQDTPYQTYIEHRLSGILADYGKGFEAPAGQRILKVEVFVDVTKDTALFKLLVVDAKESK